MNIIDPLRHRRDGSILLTMLGLLFLSIGLVISIVALSSNHRKIAFKQLNMDQAMYVAEAGLERGCRYIDSNVVSLVSLMQTSTNIAGTFNSGTYSYCITRLNSTTFSLVSTGSINGISRAVSILRIYQPTYAEFALWSHQNGAIYFKLGESFNGHVHADDPFYFSTIGGGADFHAALTSATNVWYTDGATKNGDLSSMTMDYGLELNSFQGSMADVDFNSTTNTSMKNVAASLGLVLSGTSTMSFSGSVVRITNGARSWTNYVYTPNTTNGLIYVANNGTTAGNNAGIVNLVGGNIATRLSIIAENDIVISGNITYTNDPRTNANSTCALGLVTMDDVRIATNAPNNLTIQGAVMATGDTTDGSSGSFGVDNYSSGSGRGNLTIYGGIVQNIRGAVGTFNSSGSLSTGYNKMYNYDPRFISIPPPYYPAISGTVRFANWTEGPRQ